MYQYYPEYCEAPYDMMIYLYGQAKQAEAPYEKPNWHGGRPTTNEEKPDESDTQLKPDRPSKMPNRQQHISKKKQAEIDRKEAEAKKKKLQEIKEKKIAEGKDQKK